MKLHISSSFSGLLHVNATCKKVCGDQNAWRTRAEFSHHKIALLRDVKNQFTKHTKPVRDSPWNPGCFMTGSLSFHGLLTWVVFPPPMTNCSNKNPGITKQNGPGPPPPMQSFWSKSACMPSLFQPWIPRWKWGIFLGVLRLVVNLRYIKEKQCVFRLQRV